VRRAAGGAVVEVTDDGDGFGRIPSVSGQGMSIVDQALRTCHGRLEITSGPGPGTTVRMLIPTPRDGEES
jgi:signal transduction histidine kinase